MQPYKTVFIVDTCALYRGLGTIIPNEGYPDCLPTKREKVLVVIPETAICELSHLGNNGKGNKATPYQKQIAKLLLQAIFKGFKDYTCSTDFAKTSNLGFRKRKFSLVEPTREFLNSMPTEVRKHDDKVLATALYCAMLRAGVSPVIYDPNFNFGSVDTTLVTASEQLAGKARRKGLGVMLLQSPSNGASEKGEKQKPKRRPAKHRCHHRASYSGGASYDGNAPYVQNRRAHL